MQYVSNIITILDIVINAIRSALGRDISGKEFYNF